MIEAFVSVMETNAVALRLYIDCVWPGSVP